MAGRSGKNSTMLEKHHKIIIIIVSVVSLAGICVTSGMTIQSAFSRDERQDRDIARIEKDSDESAKYLSERIEANRRSIEELYQIKTDVTWIKKKLEKM